MKFHKNNKNPMCKGKKNNKGFTLIEILLYVTILVTVVSVTMIFLQISLETKIKNHVIDEVELQGAQVTMRFNQIIRNAQDINSPNQGQSSSSISFEMSEATKNPTIIDIDQGVIYITEGTSSRVALTSPNVVCDNLNFRNLSNSGTNGNVRYEYDLRGVYSGGRKEYIYSNSFKGSASLK